LKEQEKKKKNILMIFWDFLSNDKTSSIAIPFVSIVLSLIVAAILLIALGKNPIEAFASFVRGCGFLPKPSYASGKGMITDIFSFLGIMAPMLIASIGVVIAMRANLFNIGVSGQMLASGFIATVIVGYSDLNPYIAKPVAVIIGIVVGGLLGMFVGVLKYKFNIHEVVSTIIINYIISLVTAFFINSYYSDPVTRTTRRCSNAARLMLTDVNIGGYSISIPLGIIIAIAAVIGIKIFLEKTVLGFELKNVGLNKECSRYAGVNVNRSILVAMGLSGAFAGLAGVTYYLGYYNTIYPNELSSMGYDCIAVALLGNNNPIGCIFASFLITILQAGSVYMSSTIGVSKEIASVITGIILLFSACGGFLIYIAKRQKAKWNDSEKEAM